MFNKILEQFKKDEHILIALLIVITSLNFVFDIIKMAVYFWLTKR